MRALGGHYIAPVPGGDLIRSPEILPTGRNIHAFDPFRMPTEFALRDGARQAQRLLDAHPTLPRSIALVLWGSDNIKSDGGPIAQALALMGAKPRFDSYGRLSGADLIPLAELGRPRIDVVMTLSGIFRDLLPLQTRMLAEAAWKAATADEPASQNFIRAHALAYAAQMDVDMEIASLRVFSNAEGAYGSNVNILVGSSAFGEEDELADAYEAANPLPMAHRQGDQERGAAAEGAEERGDRLSEPRIRRTGRHQRRSLLRHARRHRPRREAGARRRRIRRSISATRPAARARSGRCGTRSRSKPARAA